MKELGALAASKVPLVSSFDSLTGRNVLPGAPPIVESTQWSACVLEFTDRLDVFISPTDLIFWSSGLVIAISRHLLSPELSGRVMNTLMLAGLRPVELRR